MWDSKTLLRSRSWLKKKTPATFVCSSWRTKETREWHKTDGGDGGGLVGEKEKEKPFPRFRRIALCVCVWLGESFHVAQKCCYPQVEMCQSFAFYTYLWPWPLSYPTVFSVTSSFLSSHGWAKTRTRTRDVITYSYTVQSTKFSPLLSLLLLSSIYLYIGELDSWKSIRRAAVFLFTIDCCYVEKTGQAQSGNDGLSFNLFSWASRCLIQSDHLYHATVLWLINYSRKFPWLLGQTDLISRLETPSPRLDRMNLIIFPPIT